MKGKSLDETVQWLDEDPPVVEQNDDASQYVPIPQVESDLNTLCNHNWSRKEHKYAFHKVNDTDFLSTSIVIEVNYGKIRRQLLGGSILRLSDYDQSFNVIATGVSEATKNAVKVLGKRFGRELNDRTVLKNAPAIGENGGGKKIRRGSVKLIPDLSIRTAYAKASSNQDKKEIDKLEAMYDFTKKIENVTQG